MAYLQFFSGSRDGIIVQLSDESTLCLGSDEASQIQVPDSGIEPRHCDFYPGEGRYWIKSHSEKTVLDMSTLPPDATVELKDKAILILGQGTYVKIFERLPPDLIYVELKKIREELADLHESVEDVEKLLEQRLPKGGT